MKRLGEVLQCHRRNPPLATIFNISSNLIPLVFP